MLVNLGLPGHRDAQTDLFRGSRDKASCDNASREHAALRDVFVSAASLVSCTSTALFFWDGRSETI